MERIVFAPLGCVERVARWARGHLSYLASRRPPEGTVRIVVGLRESRHFVSKKLFRDAERDELLELAEVQQLEKLSDPCRTIASKKAPSQTAELFANTPNAKSRAAAEQLFDALNSAGW